jgi:hypothetical protein
VPLVYLGVFGGWRLWPGALDLERTGYAGAGVIAALLLVAGHRRYFVSLPDAVGHAALGLDLAAETWHVTSGRPANHPGWSFVWIALAITLVLVVYRRCRRLHVPPLAPPAAPPGQS